MPMHPELHRLRFAAPTRSNWLAPMAALALLISGCTVVRPADSGSVGLRSSTPSETSRATTPGTSAAAAPASLPATPAAAPAPLPAPPPAAAPGGPPESATLSLAGYAERLRNMPPTELPAELARLGSNAAPQSQLQLALALAQMQQLPELIRAQETVAKVLGNSSDEAKALHPVAKLLAVRFSEERRLEDLLDKQNQQVKDLQRRLDQTTERLEALKAIERSLVSRPAPVLPSVSAPPALGSRARTAPASSPAVSTPASPSTSPSRPQP